MRTATVAPGVSGVAKAHAANVVSDGEIRTARSGAPPGSFRSNVSVRLVDLPAARLNPKSSRRLVYVRVFFATVTRGLAEPPFSLNPDVPGRTVRIAVRKK
jgi:hypothetical protein